MANAHHPVVVMQGIGQLGRNFLREVGSVFWFIAHTLDESIGRIRRGRVPFRAASFFRQTERAGVESVPLVGLVSFFLGLTMALLTGYQLQRFGTERLIPGLVAIAFTRELGPLITGIMLAARVGAAFTAEKRLQPNRESTARSQSAEVDSRLAKPWLSREKMRRDQPAERIRHQRARSDEKSWRREMERGRAGSGRCFRLRCGR